MLHCLDVTEERRRRRRLRRWAKGGRRLPAMRPASDTNDAALATSGAHSKRRPLLQWTRYSPELSFPTTRATRLDAIPRQYLTLLSFAHSFFLYLPLSPILFCVSLKLSSTHAKWLAANWSGKSCAQVARARAQASTHIFVARELAPDAGLFRLASPASGAAATPTASNMWRGRKKRGQKRRSAKGERKWAKV